MKHAPIAITMGDASGIGPEIVVKTLAAKRWEPPCIVIGDAGVMANAIDKNAPQLELRTLRSIGDARFEEGCIELLSTSALSPLPPIGEVSPASGQAAFDAIIEAIDLARAGSVSAIVTAPLNKEALAAAGIHYPGHTEILTERGGGEQVAMMLANDVLRVVLVTVHCSMREALELADHDAQMKAIRLAHEGTQRFGIEHPRVAVAGMNPHAGEAGLFGREEIEIIKPAIEAARTEGIDASGPWPGDTVFMSARAGEFDVVVAQYHDQGLIPIKYLGLAEGVNITLGLPFVRTSPDHGTAFDIAGKGIADPSSMRTSLERAIALVEAATKEVA